MIQICNRNVTGGIKKEQMGMFQYESISENGERRDTMCWWHLDLEIYTLNDV